MPAANPIAHIVDRHAEDAAFLWLLRAEAVDQPHYDLDDLAELDERLLANLDGLLAAGAAGWHAAAQQLQLAEPGEVFVAAWLAAHAQAGGKLDQVLPYALTEPDNRRALISALAWHPLAQTRSLLGTMLTANDPALVAVAVRVHALHRADLGTALAPLLSSPVPAIQVAALRACGELGRQDLSAAIRPHYRAENVDVAFWAQWVGALLGDAAALELLKIWALAGAERAWQALALLCRTLPRAEVAELLRALAANPHTERLAVQGAGMSGDMHWVPGLCSRMTNPALARVCGEALSLLTGVDLAYLDLDTDEPAGWQSGPNDDPADGNVALDADDSLPWPEPTRVSAWWEANRQRFSGGERYLCGQPLSTGQCQAVLRGGYQRQRRAGALELALRQQGWFEVRSRGDLQLAQLGAGGQ